MTVTVLALLFLLFVLLITIVGYKMISRRVRSIELQRTEQCHFCKKDFKREELIERTIGDHRVVYVCPSCVKSLYDQMTSHPS